MTISVFGFPCSLKATIATATQTISFKKQLVPNVKALLFGVVIGVVVGLGRGSSPKSIRSAHLTSTQHSCFCELTLVEEQEQSTLELSCK